MLEAYLYRVHSHPKTSSERCKRACCCLDAHCYIEPGPAASLVADLPSLDDQFTTLEATAPV